MAEFFHLLCRGFVFAAARACALQVSMFSGSGCRLVLLCGDVRGVQAQATDLSFSSSVAAG